LRSFMGTESHYDNLRFTQKILRVYGKRFYDNEFVTKITDGLPLGADPSTRGSLTHPSTSNILRNIISVNSDSISITLDKNGEPLLPAFCN